MGLNTITILGRLARDPELRATQSGTSVASFTVAVERDFRDQSGSAETDWVDCVAWRQAGEFVSKYFRKGDSICVTGRLQSRKWQDRDGNKHTAWEILVDHTYFAGSKRNPSDGYAATSSTGHAQAPTSRGGTGAVNVDAGDYNDGGFEDLGYGPGDDSPYAAQYQQGSLDDGDGDLPF